MSQRDEFDRKLREAQRELDGVRGILLTYDEARHWEQNPTLEFRDEDEFRQRQRALTTEIDSLRRMIADLGTSAADEEPLAESAPDAPGPDLPALESVGVPEHIIAIVRPWREFLEWLRADPRRFLGLTPAEFQEFVFEHLVKAGFAAESVGHVNRPDGGIDIVARSPGPLDYLLAVQVESHKSWDRRTGAPKVRDFAGALDANRSVFQFGLVVTNTSFTEPAVSLMDALSDKLRRAAYPEICKWLSGTFLTRPTLDDRLPRVIELPGGPSVKIPQDAIFDAYGRSVTRSDVIESPRTDDDQRG